MSFNAIYWAARLKLPPAQKVVLIELANQCRHQGTTCFPSVETVAKAVLLSTREVYRALRALVQADLLMVQKRKTTGGRSGNLYALPNNAALSPKEAAEAAPCDLPDSQVTARDLPDSQSTACQTGRSTPDQLAEEPRKEEPRKEEPREFSQKESPPASRAENQGERDQKIDKRMAGRNEEGGLGRSEGATPVPAPSDRGEVADDGFSEFWELYPKRLGRGAAEMAWKKAIKIEAPPEIIRCLRLFALHMGDDTAYCVEPARWLREKRWRDDPAAAAAKPMNRTERTRRELDRMYADGDFDPFKIDLGSEGDGLPVIAGSAEEVAP